MHQNTIYKVNVLCHIRPFHLLNEVDFMQSLPYNVDSLPFAQRMNYAANGRIVSKKITKNTLFGDSLIYDNHYQYTNGGNRLHSVSDHHSNDAEHRFYWDGCGNMTEWIMAEVGRRPQLRTHTWTEDNRLQTVADNSGFSCYRYDAAGDRTYKLTWDGRVHTVNGRREVYYIPQSATLYASPYLVATPQGYTKHYYAGAERITSQLGRGRFADVGTPVVGDSLVQAKLQAVTGNVRYPVTLTAPSASYFSYLDTLTNRQNATLEAYWYHPDHLGSSSWITYTDGHAVQHLHYLPFGENFVDQKSNSFDGVRYTFSAKERDTETGYSYFGSRYYSSDLSIWLSVDPMASKYPSLSPYVYCANNPVMLVDPNGEEWVDANGNPITDHSKIKVYIFYDPESFGSQSKAMYEAAEQKYGKGSVAMSNVTTMDEFAKDWGDMASNDIKEVNLNYHGNNQTIMLNSSEKQYITATGDGVTNKGTKNVKNVQELPTPKGDISNAQLNLNTCKSNSRTQYELKGSKQTLMEAFHNSFNFQTVRGTSAGVSYNRFTKMPEPQWFFQSWDYMGKKPVSSPAQSLYTPNSVYYRGGHK